LSLAARAVIGRTGTRSSSSSTARVAMPRPHRARSSQYVISVSSPTGKLATVPASSPSTVIASIRISGSVRTRVKCASKAARSSGSSAVNAAIRTATGSRIWS
jgi:hypothetical protein